jgi:hypothetical protein
MSSQSTGKEKCSTGWPNLMLPIISSSTERGYVMGFPMEKPLGCRRVEKKLCESS